MTDDITQAAEQQERPIGRTSATEREAITSDKFAFWLTGDVIVNPFDIVAVDQVNQPGEPASRTYGLVTTLEHRTDAPSHLSNYISSNFGQLEEEPNTVRQGTTTDSVNVLSNTKAVALAGRVLVIHAEPGGATEALAREALAEGVPVYTLEGDWNAGLLAAGARAWEE